MRRDHREIDLSPRDRAMLDFTAKLTEEPHRMSSADLAALREAGFDDVGVLQITLIASWFNYINRVADALGVGKGDGGQV